MSNCMTCRFKCMAGCRVNTCIAARLEMMGRGEKLPKGPAQIAKGEPMGPEGLAGIRISWDGLSREFPPSVEGRRQADILARSLAEEGHHVTQADLYRDCDGPVSREEFRAALAEVDRARLEMVKTLESA